MVDTAWIFNWTCARGTTDYFVMPARRVCWFSPSLCLGTPGERWGRVFSQGTAVVVVFCCCCNSYCCCCFCFCSIDCWNFLVKALFLGWFCLLCSCCWFLALVIEIYHVVLLWLILRLTWWCYSDLQLRYPGDIRKRTRACSKLTKYIMNVTKIIKVYSEEELEVIIEYLDAFSICTGVPEFAINRRDTTPEVHEEFNLFTIFEEWPRGQKSGEKFGGHLSSNDCNIYLQKKARGPRSTQCAKCRIFRKMMSRHAIVHKSRANVCKEHMVSATSLSVIVSLHSTILWCTCDIIFSQLGHCDPNCTMSS